jgi:glycerophosphoryl diester phosphodiesterase
MQKRLPCFLIVIFHLLMHQVQAQFHNNHVIAHRGAWKSAGLPQNSIASLHEAIRLKCAASEFDVHLTKDDVLVVNHDETFYGIDIASSTYAELLTIKHQNGEYIPKAEDYIREGMKQHGTKLIFELKASVMGIDRTLYAAELSVKLVSQLKASKWVEFICFDYDAARQIILLEPESKVSYLNGDVSPEKLKKDGFYGMDYHYNIYKKNQNWIQEAHENELIVNAWTVNTVEEMKILLDQQVEFLTTDEPGLLLDLTR